MNINPQLKPSLLRAPNDPFRIVNKLKDSTDLENDLNKKLQFILNYTTDENSQQFCPYAIKRKMLALCRCSIDRNSSYQDRLKFMRIAISIGHRAAFELLVKHCDSHKIVSSLWVAVRSRGCQFLGPALQEEILRLIALALGDGIQLTRKVLVLYILQRMEKAYPTLATKTSIGHVVQILYRASCFELIKREGVSSLMKLKEQYRNFDNLRREHDAQIVTIALESGIRISPEQWSLLLYGDNLKKPHMQSIIDKLNATNPPFDQLVNRLYKTLIEGEDPSKIIDAIPYFQQLVMFDKKIVHEETCCLSNILIAVDSVIFVVIKLVLFVNFCHKKNGTYSLYTNLHRNYFI